MCKDCSDIFTRIVFCFSFSTLLAWSSPFLGAPSEKWLLPMVVAVVVVEVVVISLILPVVFFSLLQMFLDSLNRILVSWLIHTILQCYYCVFAVVGERIEYENSPWFGVCLVMFPNVVSPQLEASP